MSFYDHFKEAVREGMEGRNKGLPMHLSRLGEAVCDIQRGFSYLIGAPTGVGKSTLVDDLFVGNAYEQAKKENVPIYIDYFSFEMEVENIIAKAMVRKLAQRNIFVPGGVNTILSRGRKNKCSKELLAEIGKEEEYFRGLEKSLRVFDQAENPTGILNTALKKMEEIGEFTKSKGSNGKDYIKSYKFNEPCYYLLIIDHIALTSPERGFGRKQIIDKVSEYLVFLRKLGVTPIVVQQLNYDIDSPDRIKTGRVTPMLSDFGDSKYTTRDFSVVMSLFNFADKNIANYQGVDVSGFGDNVVLLDLLKNRYGINNLQYLLWFKGASSCFEELPKFSELRNVETYEKTALKINQYVAKTKA